MARTTLATLVRWWRPGATLRLFTAVSVSSSITVGWTCPFLVLNRRLVVVDKTGRSVFINFPRPRASRLRLALIGVNREAIEATDL